MSGWLWLALIGLAAFFSLWLGGVTRSLWSLIGAALMLGAAGYAVQERAALPGRPAVAETDPVAIPPEIAELRNAMLGRITGDAAIPTADGAYLIASDALMRKGARDSGARVVLMGLNHYPRSLILWTGLGTALTQRDHAMSPAARFAFAQAKRIAPNHPAPSFFEGLAFVEAGDYRAARRDWARALALSPPDAPYRREIAMRLAILDMVVARSGM